VNSSIFVKTFLRFTVLSLTLLSVAIVIFYRLSRNIYIDSEKSHISGAISILADSVQKSIGNPEVLKRSVHDSAEKLKMRITVIRFDGVVLADSEKDPKSMELHWNRPEVLQSQTDKFGFSIRYSETLKERMLYMTKALEEKEKIVAYLRISRFLHEVDIFLGGLKNVIIQISVGFIFLTIILAYFFARRLTKPFETLQLATSKISKGNFNVDIPSTNIKEIEDLSRHFRRMASKIDDLFHEITDQKEELFGIINTIGDGLVVINEKGITLLSNQTFNEIVGKTIQQGVSLIKEIPMSELIDFIKKVLKGTKIRKIEFTHLEKVYEVVAVEVLKPEKDIILVVHDISEIRNLENIKKDLIANVSHELRTPLTAIKGFLETLEDSIDKKSKNYLDILNRHTDRMINIVQDLLILSSLEDEKADLDYNILDIDKVLTNVTSVLHKKANEKNLKIILHSNREPILISGDEFRLEQAFLNLIENAVKYTEKGSVEISVQPMNTELIIKIIDTGPGIPKKHQSRIFERFYVVDSSRSRKLGGTGLGLSIVKHIIQMHRGKIKLLSEPGSGCTFIISLPLHRKKAKQK